MSDHDPGNRRSDPPALPGVEHEYVDAGGLRVHVALAGPAEAPPVVLVHGWPQNWWTWRNVIPSLAQRHRVIAVDLRGHGWTEAPAAGYEKEQLATDVLAVLETLGVERVTWVGHDWGGFTGLLAALRAPERFERLLVACIPHLWTPRRPRQLATMLSYQVPISSPVLGPRIADRMVRAILQTGRGDDRLTGDEVDLFASHIPASVSVAMYRTFLTRELPPMARGHYAEMTLEVPTTVLLGARDVVTKGALAGPVAGQPQMHIELVDGVAHWLPEQRPDRIIDQFSG